MRGVGFLCFLLLIPAMAILGHDVYLAYTKIEQDASQPFHLSDVGWLWVTYSPASYDWLHDSVDPEIWTAVFSPLMRATALLVAVIPAVAVYVTSLILKLMDPGTISIATRIFTGKGAKLKKGGYAFKGLDKEKGRVKYKRK